MNYGVSIIIASYNKGGLIADTLSSVLGQTYSDWELLIVDDHSTDETLRVAEDMASKEARIRIFSNTENRGANYCRNFGIAQARGKYLLFLDADDLLDKQCLQRRMEFLQNNPELDLAVFTLQVFHKTPGDSTVKWVPASKDPLRDFLVHDLPWQTMQPLWKKEFMIHLKGFDETFQRLQDVELHTRALLVPGIKYALRPGVPDCYFRIDEARKNFSAFELMKRWVNSAVKYCDKFLLLVPAEQKPLLAGTIYQTYLQLLYNYKQKNLKKEEFEQLEEKLLQQPGIKNSWKRRMLFGFSKMYNLQLPRIPGINKTIKYFVIR